MNQRGMASADAVGLTVMVTVIFLLTALVAYAVGHDSAEANIVQSIRLTGKAVLTEKSLVITGAELVPYSTVGN